VIGFAASSAYTASNAVPATYVGQYSHSIGPNELKPPGCASLTLGHLILGGTIGGSGSDDDLILGTSGADTISISGTVGPGSCIIGGLGNDKVTAVKNGNDICIINAGVNGKNCATVITQP
jgi:Ca2+-binding RTX toxin-like protein